VKSWKKGADNLKIALIGLLVVVFLLLKIEGWPNQCPRGVYVIKSGTVPNPGEFSWQGSSAFGKAGGIEGARVEWFYRETPERDWEKIRVATTNELGFDKLRNRRVGEFRIVASYQNESAQSFTRIITSCNTECYMSI
jgi:hypothetical protein